ncbi:hypothetical protein E3N88_44072 [Mikania micrantha]|uniref:Uncharacterized protein n=1 Tax=Mikania micrantha TaxID=192012 RepID=A0A5N6LDA1_9ASTR|nr:hypothetical protein E3N88_44072 [Mikania micrantha]
MLPKSINGNKYMSYVFGSYKGKYKSVLSSPNRHIGYTDAEHGSGEKAEVPVSKRLGDGNGSETSGKRESAKGSAGDCCQGSGEELADQLRAHQRRRFAGGTHHTPGAGLAGARRS